MPSKLSHLSFVISCYNEVVSEMRRLSLRIPIVMGAIAMSTNAVIVQGVAKRDGTLEVSEKLSLPAARVQIVVQPKATN
jgi:hypothetical protein